MRVIVDSGGTKSAWVSSEGHHFSLDGINPNVHSKDHINSVLKAAKNQLEKETTQIYFYGAGCSTEGNKSYLKALFQEYFNGDINIEHDLLAACRAANGNSAGLVGILGTGSNACYFDGENIVAEKISLGYVMGDEGGGADLGKRLIKLYVEGLLHPAIEQKFEKQYSFGKKEIISAFYKAEKPNAFLGNFAPFLLEHPEDKILQAIIIDSFQAYFDFFISPLKQHSAELNLVGSTAFYFREHLVHLAEINNIELKGIVKDPISALKSFHQL